jgi:hypothetical protein
VGQKLSGGSHTTLSAEEQIVLATDSLGANGPSGLAGEAEATLGT